MDYCEDRSTSEADLTVNNISRFSPDNRVVCGQDEAIENSISMFLSSNGNFSENIVIWEAGGIKSK